MKGFVRTISVLSIFAAIACAVFAVIGFIGTSVDGALYIGIVDICEAVSFFLLAIGGFKAAGKKSKKTLAGVMSVLTIVCLVANTAVNTIFAYDLVVILRNIVLIAVVAMFMVAAKRCTPKVREKQQITA